MGVIGKKLPKKLRSWGLKTRQHASSKNHIVIHTLPEADVYQSGIIAYPSFKVFHNKILVIISSRLYDVFYYPDELSQSMELAQDLFDYMNCLKSKPKTTDELEKQMQLFFVLETTHKGFYE